MAQVKEVPVGAAVKKLREDIDGRIASRAKKVLSYLHNFVLALAKLCIAIFAAWEASTVLGTSVGISLLALLMLLWFASSAWNVAMLAQGRIKVNKGILVGISYPRIAEQYANVEAEPRRSTNIADMLGSPGKYYVDYDSEPNPHVLMVGSSGSGKTSTAKTFICRNYLKYGTHFLMIDWNGDNEAWAAECGAILWKVPLNFKINMFKLSGMNPEQRASMIEDALLIAGRMTMLQATKVRNMALRAYMEGGEPTLDGIMETLNRDGRKNSLITFRLSAIWRVIGDEPDAFWKSIFENNTVISLAGLNESEKAVVAYFLLQRICELFEKEEPGRKESLLVVVDEAWQLLNSSNRLGTSESLAERVVRVGRRYGFGIMTSTQQLGDVPESFINSSSLIFLHNYRQLQQNKLALSQFDLAYLGSAGQGECLIFDRLRAQKGQTHSDYVKVSQLNSEEYASLKAKSAAFDVPSYAIQGRTPELPKAPMPASIRKSPFKIPEGAPSPAEHAALLAIFYSTDKTKSGLISYIKDKGWIRSETTLYGYTAKPGVLDCAASAGFAAKTRDSYGLTEEGLKWVDPEHILVNQSDKLGSEEHKRLLISTIHKLHEENMLVITSRIKHSPDLIAWPVHQKKRYLWDSRGVKGYEAQTSARKDAIKQNGSKSNLWNVPIKWVTNSTTVSIELNEKD